MLSRMKGMSISSEYLNAYNDPIPRADLADVEGKDYYPVIMVYQVFFRACI